MNLSIKKNIKTIFYLNRQQITVCSTGLPTPLTLDLPSRIVTDIEIIDIEAFNILLSEWLVKNNIPPGDVVIVLSPSVYYQKDGSLTDDTVQKTAQLDSFLHTVPFKNIFSKDYFINNKLKFIALNKDFYEPIIRILEKNLYNINALIPSFILENFQLTLTDFSVKEITSIFNQQKIIFPLSLISAIEIDKSLASTIHHEAENKTRTKILALIFIILWVVLLVYIFVYPRFVTPKYSKTPVSTYVPKPTLAEVEPTSAPTPSSNYLSHELVRLKVINASGVPGLANQIKTLLNKNNFKNIIVETNSTTGQKSLISYSAKISPEMISQIKTLLEPQYGIFIDKLVDNLSDADIVITKITP